MLPVALRGAENIDSVPCFCFTTLRFPDNRADLTSHREDRLRQQAQVASALLEDRRARRAVQVAQAQFGWQYRGVNTTPSWMRRPRSIQRWPSKL